MGCGHSKRISKFYERQTRQVEDILKDKAKGKSISLENYLKICEELGREPDPNKMPLAEEAYPYELQIVLLLYSLLPDRWEGMSGVYLGKDWNSLETLFKIYQIKDQKEILYFMKTHEIFSIEAAEDQRKIAERSAKNKAKNGR